MTEPINFPASTPNFGLPLLFVGQSQKEFFVNQSLAHLDALLQHSVVSSINVPPPMAEDGECFRIIGAAGGEWTGREDSIALRIAGAWQFVAPAKGMAIYDRNAEHWLHFNGGWHSAIVPESPQGGTTIDAEARAILTEIVEALQTLGIFGQREV